MEARQSEYNQNQEGLAVGSPPNLFAWCSRNKNKISVYDLEAKQGYAQFNGANLDIGERTWRIIF